MPEAVSKSIYLKGLYFYKNFNGLQKKEKKMAEDLKKMYRTIMDDHFPPEMEISFVDQDKNSNRGQVQWLSVHIPDCKKSKKQVYNQSLIFSFFYLFNFELPAQSNTDARMSS